MFTDFYLITFYPGDIVASWGFNEQEICQILQSLGHGCKSNIGIEGLFGCRLLLHDKCKLKPGHFMFLKNTINLPNNRHFMIIAPIFMTIALIKQNRMRQNYRLAA